MKIRARFISNSSSSSFICGMWGTNEYDVEETTAILQKMLNFYNDLENKNLTFNNVFENPRIATDIDIDFLEDWDVKGTIKDRILINSISDNTIPFLLFGLIEEKFHAERIHLGLKLE